MNKLSVVIGLFIIILIAAAVLILLPPSEVQAPVTEVTSFIECSAAGYPVAESYPRQCSTPEGTHFVEDIGNALEKVDLVQATSPLPNTTISSPLVVSGEARGFWYFEASFPIEVLDAGGGVIGQGYAQAQGEWMTEEFVPFESIPITFTAQPTGSMGKVILKKDNPSGLPENDDQLEIPVMF